MLAIGEHKPIIAGLGDDKGAESMISEKRQLNDSSTQRKVGESGKIG